MGKNVAPNILILNPYSLNHIGKISNFTEFEWNKKTASQADVELWCPLTEQNTALLKKKNLIYLDDDHIAVIETIDEELNDKGEKTLDVKALTLEKYLNYRMITGTYYATNSYVSNIMKDVVSNNAINPSDEKRKIPFLEFGVCEEDKGGPIQHQKTGGQLNEELEELASTYSLCFNISANLKQKKLLFNVKAGVNRSANNGAVSPVVLDTDLKDILSSSYSTSMSDLKNVALVAGAGEGSDRKCRYVGELESKGIDRKELYVDARDLSDTDSESNVISDDEYSEMLDTRGNEKLDENKEIESFSSKIRTVGETNYTFGVDYFLGDTVTMRDKILGVEVDAVVASSKEIWSDKGYSLEISFGFGKPKIAEKVKSVKKKTNSSPAVIEKVNASSNAVSSKAVQDELKGYVTSEDAKEYCTLNTTQTISGAKTFTSIPNCPTGLKFGQNNAYHLAAGGAILMSYFRANAASVRSAIDAGLNVGGYENKSYTLSTASFICNSWIRTVGNTGWYNETYGGGIYMTDTSWVKVYGSKAFLVSNTLRATGEIQTSSTNSYRHVSGAYGTFWRNDGSNLYLMFTNSGDQYGSYNSLRPITVELATGKVHMGHALRVANGIWWYQDGTEYRTVFSHNNGIYSLASASGYLELSTNLGAKGITWWDSDERFKKNVEPTTENALDAINKIKHYSFDWKDESRTSLKLGYIAQQLEEVEELFVLKIDQTRVDDSECEYDYTLQVDETHLIPYITKAIQELYEIVQEQSKEIQVLKGADNNG